ncbi:MAG: hypothetical protein WD934_09230 [Gemmatimonadales bacterium]
MTRLMLVVLACLLFPACSNTTHIRSAIGEVSPAQVNLGRWEYTRSLRTINLQWARIGPPVWVRRSEDGGLYAIGLVIDRGSWYHAAGTGTALQEYRPGRTHLVAVAYDAEGRVRRPSDELRFDLDAMVRSLRAVAW